MFEVLPEAALVDGAAVRVHRLIALIALVLASAAGAAEAPSAGDLAAQALAYEHGEGVPKDQRKAAALYCEAARSGNVERDVQSRMDVRQRPRRGA